MSSVWIKTPDSTTKQIAFLPAEIVSSDGDSVEVKLEASGEGLTKGEVHKVSKSDTRPRFDRGDGVTAADNTALVHMNDASILDNLAARHKKDQIYTYTASVLLAMNPYKNIAGLYGNTQCSEYRGKHLGALPPHPYAIADTCYRTLVREKLNQALLISGESGAGKTETAKIVMQYLAFASGSESEHAAKVQERVLQAQPILESLGNAVTLRNSNSSRFGKYNRVYFDESGALVDAGIQTYLLESSRVVTHGERERTYHVFYEMIQGLGADKLSAFHLDGSKQYRLLHNDGLSATGFEDRDKGNFSRLTKALETVGYDQADIEACCKVLAGLVHLGDIPKEDAEVDMATRAAQEDDEDSDTRTVEVNEDSVKYAAELLGMDADELCGVLKRKKLRIPGRDSMHEVPRSPMQFRQALHSLIKALYKRLFERTVSTINKSFQELRQSDADDSAWKNIGILDIYGFERLQRNSFEQLCINLANERLQQYFVENVLVAEQHLYTREGLPWTGLTMPNSEPVVNCIASVFKTLDDFSGRLAKGFGEGQQVSDEHFCERVVKESTSDPERNKVLKPIKVSAKEARSGTGARQNEFFVITHYAGTVDYCTKGWLDKNNDRLLLECEALVSESTCALVKSLGDEDSKTAFRSISAKYSKDLEALLKTLSEANLHYIRCFKPNALQKPDLFDGQLVLDQIVQCGTIELVKIMHDGFPNRCSFDELYNRFKNLLPEKFQRYGMRTFIEALMLAYEVPRNEWALGMSRLFLKAGQLKALEDMRSGGVVPKPEILEKIVKEIIRKRWSRACVAVRLCIWLPKFMRKAYVERAATKVSAVAVVTSRIAPRLEAAKRRVHEKRQRLRRRLVGAFRLVHCLNQSFKEIKEKRRQRATQALYTASLILHRTKPWIARARACLAETELRRQREEERRRQEMERKLKEEEERMRAEAEQRLREEEEKRRVEGEKRRQEEEERLAAEAEKRRLEEEAAAKRREEEEAERQRQEEERKRQDEERIAAIELERQNAEKNRDKLRKEMEEQMAEEKRIMQQTMQETMRQQMAAMMAEERAKIQASLSQDVEARLAAERRELEEQKRHLQELQKQARLSVSAVNSIVTTAIDDEASAETDLYSEIGDSASCVNVNGAQIRDGIQAMISEQVAKEAKAEVQRIMQQQNAKQIKEHMEMQATLAAQVHALTQKNAMLEKECQKGGDDSVELSPPAHGTPPRYEHGYPSPLMLSQASPLRSGSAKKKNKHYDAASTDGDSIPGTAALSAKDKRRSVLGVFHEYSEEIKASGTRSRTSISKEAVSNQRTWWAEQRNNLMQDLYER